MPPKGKLLDVGMPGVDHVPMPQGAEPNSKRLIAAILAAGKDGCECQTCQLMKRFGEDLSNQMIDEDKQTSGGK